MEQNSLSKLESSLPEESSDKEPAVETAPFGEHFEVLRHTLTPKQLSSEVTLTLSRNLWMLMIY